VRRFAPLLILLTAFAVRVAYVSEIRDLETFDVPLIDGANYFRTATAIASGNLLAGSEVFWQPPLYPYFLAGVMALVGRGMFAIYLVQAVVGALSCLLVQRIGRRVFGEAAGMWGAGIMALYGPLIYFDAQPLIPVLHIFLMLAGLLLLLRAAGVPEPSTHSRRDWVAAGLAWGLAAIATPNLLVCAPLAAIWARRRSRPAAAPLVLFLCGIALPVGLVTLRNVLVTGEWVLLSSNSGINLYIGNNPDYETTVRIRPGGEFERLAQQPENVGILTASGKSRYFSGRAVRFLAGEPIAAARLYGRKALDLIAGREIPRNEDIYGYARHAPLLRALVWRAGVAFPFGVVAPLALAGALLPARRQAGADQRRKRATQPDPADAPRSGRQLLLLCALGYAASVLLFFPTDRYRLPLVPIATLFAGNLLAAGVAAWKRPTVAAALVGGLVFFNLDAARRSETWPEEEALNRAYALEAKGKRAAAWSEYERAARLNPLRIDAYNSMAVMASTAGRWDEVARLYEKVLNLAPDFAEVHNTLGLVYDRLERVEDGRGEWEKAIALAPAQGSAMANLCLSYLRAGAIEAAAPHCASALRGRPDLGEVHFAAGVLAKEQGDTERARRELTTALGLFPAGHGWRRQTSEMLARLKAGG
jgi:Flp pilus assembly protein TadD/4-amino-4-deoxy-L-arabinose transferase-like glycosyltransferase